MRKQEIEKRISEAANMEIPDVFSKINLENIKIEPVEKRHFNFNFGKIMKYAVSTFALIITAVLVYNNFFSPINNTNTPLETNEEIIGFQTVTGAILLDELNVVELSYSQDDYLTQLSDEVSEEIDVTDYLDEINSLIHVMESILNQDSDIIYESFVSDDQNYEYAFKYTTNDLADNEITYLVYYNNDTDNLNGKIVFGDKVFEFSEIDNKIIIKINDDNYIEVLNNSSEEQQEFNYRLYTDGNMVLENTMQLYRVAGALEVKSEVLKNGKILNLQAQRRFMSNYDELEVEYEIKENSRVKTGNFKVNLEFDQSINGFKYMYVFDNDDNGKVEGPRRPFDSPNQPGPKPGRS
jgi:energy-converting hydrogenase Eha subunit H